MSHFALQDRTALILGPVTTTVRQIATTLTQAGANVALLDENHKNAQSLAQQLSDEREINDRFGRALAIQVDFQKPISCQEGLRRAAEGFGSLDLYIDALTQGFNYSEFAKIEIDTIEKNLNMSLGLSLHMTHYMIPFLKGRKRGRVVYLFHDQAQMGLKNHSLLAAGRMGLLAFARCLARELQEDRVTVNCVGIGLTEDYLLATGELNSSIEKVKEKFKQGVPWAQFNEPDRVAALVSFLCTTQALGITGQTLSASDALHFY